MLIAAILILAAATLTGAALCAEAVNRAAGIADFGPGN